MNDRSSHRSSESTAESLELTGRMTTVETGAGPTVGRLLQRILPATVVAEEMRGAAEDTRLLPEEAAQIGNAVESRRRDFAAVRKCARRALRALGLPETPILSGEHREPLWPAGVVGSLTHCADYRAAALARASEIATIGIDAEPHAPLPPDVLPVIALAEERARLTELTRRDASIHWDRLLFCAKEAVYKAWFPLTHRWLSFEQASITIDREGEDSGRFFARLLVKTPPTVDGEPMPGFDGRWLVGDGVVLTAIAVPRTGHHPSGVDYGAQSHDHSS